MALAPELHTGVIFHKICILQSSNLKTPVMKVMFLAILTSMTEIMNEVGSRHHVCHVGRLISHLTWPS